MSSEKNEINFLSSQGGRDVGEDGENAGGAVKVVEIVGEDGDDLRLAEENGFYVIEVFFGVYAYGVEVGGFYVEADAIFEVA